MHRYYDDDGDKNAISQHDFKEYMLFSNEVKELIIALERGDVQHC